MSALAAAASPQASVLVPICVVADVPLGEGRAVTVGTRRIAIFHTPTGWYALDNACPHRGGPLADGLVADHCVTCPLHERRFDLETGVALTEGDAIATHRVILRGDDVLVALASRS
jgi:nitrite reductase (NADH) small subunit